MGPSAFVSAMILAKIRPAGISRLSQVGSKIWASGLATLSSCKRQNNKSSSAVVKRGEEFFVDIVVDLVLFPLYLGFLERLN